MGHVTAREIGRRTRDERRVGLFEDRYGKGSRARLIALLRQPCVTFATIAAEFGVTRERVRQWHLDLLPGAPQGHARRHLCQEYRWKQGLLANPLFRTFYRDVRQHLGRGRLTLIRSAEGFRLRRVRLDGHLVALHDARSDAGAQDTSRRWRPHAPRVWSDADFVYLCLSDDRFLFLPSALALADARVHAHEPTPDHARYLNTFDALDGASLAPEPDAPGEGAADHEWARSVES